jgi:hypothetical protein
MHAAHRSQNLLPIVIGFRIAGQDLPPEPDMELLVDLDLSVHADDLIEAVALAGQEGGLEASRCRGLRGVPCGDCCKGMAVEAFPEKIAPLL